MNLQEFIALKAPKYAVVSILAYYNFPVATAMADSPTTFDTGTMAYAILSILDPQLPSLIGYIRTIGFDVEFGFTEGTGKVSLLTRDQVLELLETYPTEV